MKQIVDVEVPGSVEVDHSRVYHIMCVVFRLHSYRRHDTVPAYMCNGPV